MIIDVRWSNIFFKQLEKCTVSDYKVERILITIYCADFSFNLLQLSCISPRKVKILLNFNGRNKFKSFDSRETNA